jgi:hypothetical protein
MLVRLTTIGMSAVWPKGLRSLTSNIKHCMGWRPDIHHNCWTCQTPTLRWRPDIHNKCWTCQTPTLRWRSDIHHKCWICQTPTLRWRPDIHHKCWTCQTPTLRWRPDIHHKCWTCQTPTIRPMCFSSGYPPILYSWNFQLSTISQLLSYFVAVRFIWFLLHLIQLDLMYPFQFRK